MSLKDRFAKRKEGKTGLSYAIKKDFDDIQDALETFTYKEVLEDINVEYNISASLETFTTTLARIRNSMGNNAATPGKKTAKNKSTTTNPIKKRSTEVAVEVTPDPEKCNIPLTLDNDTTSKAKKTAFQRADEFIAAQRKKDGWS